MPGLFAGGVRSRQSNASTRPKIRRYSRAPGGQGLPGLWGGLITSNAKAAFWAEDPAFVNPGDGNPVAVWPGTGTEVTADRGITANGFENDGNAGTVVYANAASTPAWTDFSLIARVSATDWTPTSDMTIMAHSNGSTGPKFQVNATTGELEVHAANGGTIAQSSAAPGFSDGRSNYYWVKAEFRDSDDRVQFFTSTTDTDTLGSVSWSQLGTDVTLTGGMTYGALAWVIGGNNASGTQNTPWDGVIRQVVVMDGLHSGGSATTVLSQDFTGKTVRQSALTDGTYPGSVTRLDVFVSPSSAVQHTGSKQPDYVASVAALNNRPAIRGDGTDDLFATAAWSSALTSGYAFIVGNIGSGDYIMDGIGASNRWAMLSVGITFNMLQGSVLAGTTSGNDLAPHLFTLTFDTTDLLDVDGANQASGDAGTNTLTGLTLLNRFDTAVANAGDLAFIAVFDKASLTAGQVTQIEQALAVHYGITLA